MDGLFKRGLFAHDCKPAPPVIRDVVSARQRESEGADVADACERG
jgi:hypothetical protein